MNKKDRRVFAEMIADWEWGSSGGSSSEAAALGACAEEVRRAVGLTDEDLGFYRAWVVFQQAHLDTLTHENEFELLCDLFEEDYRTAVDKIEDVGFAGVETWLRDRLAGDA